MLVVVKLLIILSSQFVLLHILLNKVKNSNFDLINYFISIIPVTSLQVSF